MTFEIQGTGKQVFSIGKPVAFYFINCVRYATANSTTRTIANVGKVLFKLDGTINFTPVANYSGQWKVYGSGCEFTLDIVDVKQKQIAPPPDPDPDPEPTPDPIPTGEFLGAKGPSFTSTLYNWGRTIGNTSKNQYGDKLIRAMRSPTGIAELNGYLYMTTGFVEGNSGIMKVPVGTFDERTEVIPAQNGDITLNTTHITSDGNMLYVAGFDSYGAISSAVIGIKNDQEYIFSGGSSFKCKWQDTAYKSGIHVNKAKITGLDVDATTLYVYCGTTCYTYNKSTGVLIGQTNVATPTSIAKVSRGSNTLEMTTTDVKYNGKVICKGYTSPKIDNYTYCYKDFNSPQMIKGSVCIGANGVYVTDSGNSRVLYYGFDGVYKGQVAYVPMNYNCAVDRNNPKRVFAGLVEYEVDYTTMQWKCVANWGYNVGTTYLPNIENDNYQMLRDVITVNGKTLCFMNNNNLMELTPSGMVFVKSYSGNNHITTTGQIASMTVSSGTAKFYLDGVQKESVSTGTTAMAGSLNARIGYTEDGSFVVYCDNKDHTGYHLSWVKGGVVKNAMPFRSITQSQATAKPFVKGDFFPVDPNVEYAGGWRVYTVGNRVFVNYVGEFFGGSGGQTNLWYEYNNGTYINSYGLTAWESRATDQTECARQEAGNSYGGGVVSVGGKTYIITNCEHTGALQWFQL